VPATHVPRGLRPAEQEVHDLIFQWGALRLVDLVQACARGVIASLVDEGELYLHPTLIGPCVILGPWGLARAGKRASARPSTDSVMNSAYMAHAVSILVSDDRWSFVARTGRSQYLLDDAQGQRWTVIGQARGHTARTLRRLIKPLRYHATIHDEHILIVTPDRRRARSIALKNPRVSVLHLRMLRHVQRRSLRERSAEMGLGAEHEQGVEESA